MVLVGLDIAGSDADQRVGDDRQLGVGRRRQDDLAGPRQQPVGQLEPAVLLADDEHALAGIRRGGPDIGVVVGEFHARAGRGLRLGDPDGDDERVGAVPAVGRLDDEPLAVRGRLARCRRPAAVVADGDAGPVDEGREVGLHLGSRREVRRSVHERRPGWPGSPASRRAASSSRSARRRACRARTGACGLVHDSRRWKNGQRRNMPPGDGSSDRTACSMPSRPSEYEICSAPAPEPMTTTG